MSTTFHSVLRRRPHPCHSPRRVQPSFPTRRSSDLCPVDLTILRGAFAPVVGKAVILRDARRAAHRAESQPCQLLAQTDRKSTRLNSSHVESSYAVFCLKKKKERKQAEELPAST